MGIFGSNPGPQRLMDMRVNQSVYGYPVPVVMGTAQVQQSVLWEDGFSSKKVTAGGKGGGKGGDQYLYSADVVVGLCCGEVIAVGDVWSGQSWLGNPDAAESYTITSPYTYTPTNASTYIADQGVYTSTAYSSSNNDYGAPSATVLSGHFNTVMVKKPFGATLASGEYSVNPTGNVYNFSSADNGTAVTIPYTYQLTTVNQQETDIIPSGQSITVTPQGTGSAKVTSDFGVVYGPDSSTPGVALTKVSSSPSTGQYSIGSLGGSNLTYSFGAGDINTEVVITFGVTDPNAVGQGEPKVLNYTLANGALGQSPYSFLTSSYPDAAFSYSGIATALYTPMDLGYSASAQQNRYEVITSDAFGAGVEDCNPVQCIGQVLTNPNWGLGAGPVPFPTSVIDNGASGTWGEASATGGVATSNSTAFNWFAAQNCFVSPVIDSQDTAASIISKWLEAGMCAGFMSESLFKLVPYGDTSAAANGCTWTAPTNFVVALDDTNFLPGSKEDDPVKITRSDAADAWNTVQVQWNNRQNQYSPEITQESDQGFVQRWGERREDAQDWDFIHTQAAATFAANMRLKRGLYIRNTYEFGLPYTYSYLEPMDIVTISTTSTWAQGLNNADIGIADLPVRITKIVDDPVKGLQITAEDYPWGAHQPVIYNKQEFLGDVVADAYADPGNTEVVFFQATDRLTQYAGNQLWFVGLGAGDSWGSCNIWVSQDDTTYQQIGAIETPGRIGALAQDLASTVDQEPITSPNAYDANAWIGFPSSGSASLSLATGLSAPPFSTGMIITTATQYAGAGVANGGTQAKIPVAVGGLLEFSAWMVSDGTFEIYGNISVYESNGTLINDNLLNIGLTTSTTWAQYSGSVTVPALAGYITVEFVRADNGGLGQTAYVTGVSLTGDGLAGALVIDLVENSGEWFAGTTADADNDTTMMFVDGEIISYSSLYYSGQNQITLGTYIRRGQMGSTISAHSSTGVVALLDDTVFKYTYDPNWIGKTLYFKFQSVNNFGNNPQDLSGLTSVPFTIPNANVGSIDSFSGLVFPQFLGVTASSNVCYNGDFRLYNGTPVPNNFGVYNNGAISATASIGSGLGAVGGVNSWTLTAGANVTNTFGFDFVATTPWGSWQPNTNYVVSFYAKVSTNPSGCAMEANWNDPPATQTWLLNPKLTSSYQLYAVSFNFENSTIDPQGFFSISPTTAPSGFAITFSNVMVQQGTTAGGWSAPVDGTFVGAWSSTLNYVPGDQVTEGGNTYSCVVASKNQQPPNATYWTLIGPTSLDNLNDGTTYSRTLTYNSNLIPDSDFKFPSLYWSRVGGSGFTLVSTAQPSAQYAWGPGTGGATGFNYITSTIINVTPNATYTLSGYIDAISVTAGSPNWNLFDPTIGTGYASANQTAGVAGRVSTTFTVPSGVTQVVCLFDTGNCTLTSGDYIYWGQPQLVAGTEAGAYISSDLDASTGTPLINFGNTGHLNKTLANISNGSQRFAATSSTLSYRPLTNPLSAADAGSNVTLTIASFTMRASGLGDISVTGGSITGLSYGTVYYIYYNDPTLSGGAVTFQDSTTKEAAIDGAGLFYVGSILTPVHGASASTGNNDGGAQSGGTTTVWPSTASGLNNNANGINNYATPATPASSAVAGATYSVSGFSGLLQPACQGISLVVDWASGWSDGAVINVTNPSTSHNESSNFSRKTTTISLGTNINPSQMGVAITAGSSGSSTMAIYGCYLVEVF